MGGKNLVNLALYEDEVLWEAASVHWSSYAYKLTLAHSRNSCGFIETRGERKGTNSPLNYSKVHCVAITTGICLQSTYIYTHGTWEWCNDYGLCDVITTRVLLRLHVTITNTEQQELMAFWSVLRKYVLAILTTTDSYSVLQYLFLLSPSPYNHHAFFIFLPRFF